MKITIKQERFAHLWIETGNATQSYIDAGYKATSRKVAEANARKLLANNSVKKYIEEQMRQIEDERIADAKEVMKYLTSVMRGESKAEAVVVEGIGGGCSEARRILKHPDEKERLKAAELLGKRYKLFTDKVEHEEKPIEITIKRKE